MEKLRVKLENCYGINKMDVEFDFSTCHMNLIYAPNGSMKTSFSNIFQRLSIGEEPEEKIYGKQPAYEIKMDGADIKAEEIFVIEPFNESFEAENISTLLINKDKKARYDKIYSEILAQNTKLISHLNKLSKIKKDDIEKQLLNDFHKDDYFQLLIDLEDGLKENLPYKFSGIQYKTIFDANVLELLEQEGVKKNISKYIEKYNELIEKSNYFKKGVFNPVKAENVVTSLKKENFFDADHSILLHGEEVPITKADSLNKKFIEEKEKIITDPELKKIGDLISKSVVAVKTFQDVLESNSEITLELADIGEFRIKIWKSYLQESKKLFSDLLESYKAGKSEMEQIEKDAKIEETQWFEAKEIFKRRFYVPFKIDIENKENVILGTKSANIVFKFEDEGSGKCKTYNKNELQSLRILSQGERRALYLLYIIFEVRARLSNSQKTIFIIDDIADSFDYKNKYAIIEYLKEMSEENEFFLIILTHNFDFYRTVQGRILDTARWDNSYIAQREDTEIKLIKGGSRHVVSPFDVWKRKLSENDKMLVSSIPFVRTLIEYKDGSQCEEFLKLTAMLHIKPNSDALTLNDLEIIFK